MHERATGVESLERSTSVDATRAGPQTSDGCRAYQGWLANECQVLRSRSPATSERLVMWWRGPAHCPATGVWSIEQA